MQSGIMVKLLLMLDETATPKKLKPRKLEADG
jgi:hypothetical protein